MTNEKASPKKPVEVQARRPGRSFNYVKAVKNESAARKLAEKAQRRGFDVEIVVYDFSDRYTLSYQTVASFSAFLPEPW
jgi:predicted transcriptional regulator